MPTPSGPTPPPAPTPAGGACVKQWQVCSAALKCCPGLKCSGNQCS
jgi:hypothetical protein